MPNRRRQHIEDSGKDIGRYLIAGCQFLLAQVAGVYICGKEIAMGKVFCSILSAAPAGSAVTSADTLLQIRSKISNEKDCHTKFHKNSKYK